MGAVEGQEILRGWRTRLVYVGDDRIAIVSLVTMTWRSCSDHLLLVVVYVEGVYHAHDG